MFLEVAPHAPTKYVGCRGFEGTIAQEGGPQVVIDLGSYARADAALLTSRVRTACQAVVNPVRKAYRVGGDGSWVFLHGGFPKLKKGILRFLNVSEVLAYDLT
jgi:hypothetical protein